MITHGPSVGQGLYSEELESPTLESAEVPLVKTVEESPDDGESDGVSLVVSMARVSESAGAVSGGLESELPNGIELVDVAVAEVGFDELELLGPTPTVVALTVCELPDAPLVDVAEPIVELVAAVTPVVVFPGVALDGVLLWPQPEHTSGTVKRIADFSGVFCVRTSLE
jgi:hypothetical protein